MKEIPINVARLFTVDSFDTPEHVATEHLITSCRLEITPGPDLIRIWNRGAKSGEIVVRQGDGEAIIARLLSVFPPPARIPPSAPADEQAAGSAQ